MLPWKACQVPFRVLGAGLHLLRDVPPWKDVLEDSSFRGLGAGLHLRKDVPPWKDMLGVPLLGL